jgi:hypothetical protein
MINKSVPGFCFTDPKNRNTLNIRFTSVNVNVGTRPLRAMWTPELAQDVGAFHAFDAEAELTALLGQHIANEIDRQIIQDLTDNQRFYDGNNTANVINRWNQIGGNILINEGHRAPQDAPAPGFGNIALPLIRRVAAQTMGLDLVAVQPLAAPTGLLTYLDYNNGYIMGIDPIDENYTVLPNDDGWYTKGTFESTFINMNMKPYKFIPITRRGRRRPTPLTPTNFIR